MLWSVREVQKASELRVVAFLVTLVFKKRVNKKFVRSSVCLNLVIDVRRPQGVSLTEDVRSTETPSLSCGACHRGVRRMTC